MPKEEVGRDMNCSDCKKEVSEVVVIKTEESESEGWSLFRLLHPSIFVPTICFSCLKKGWRRRHYGKFPGDNDRMICEICEKEMSFGIVTMIAKKKYEDWEYTFGASRTVDKSIIICTDCLKKRVEKET